MIKSPARLTITIEMVAREAGVSPSTISRILNGSAVVSEAKKRAVEAAIAKLGFVPNPIARGLAGGRTLSIGVITQAIDSPFYGAALRGIEDALEPLGYSPLFVSGHWTASLESRGLDVLLSRRVDGIIVLTGRLPDATLKSCAKRVPVVVTGRDLKGANLYSLNFDNAQGARLATRHLLDLGHRRIAFIAGEADHPDSTQRLKGYCAELEAARVPYRADLVASGRYSEQSGLDATLSLLKQRRKFTAVFASNDQMAIGAVHGLHAHQLSVPGDVSVVGFDDLPTSEYAIAPLTTVRQPAYDMGRLAALSVMDLIAGARPAHQIPAPALVVRASTAALAQSKLA